LNSTIPDSLLSCQNNFVCFRKDRDRFGGGVCILVNSALNIVPVPKPAKFCSLEIAAIDVIGCDLKTELLLCIAHLTVT